MERDRIRRQEAMVERKQTQEMETSTSLSGATRTTAEPRPNAYIAEEYGIPKPYGYLAPFKPSLQGSTMRHVRNPVVQEIEL